MTGVIGVPSQAYWFLTRGTGVVSLLLLTASVVLGIVNSQRWSPAGSPRFVLQRVHRNVSLAVIVFIAIHVVTAVADSFAPIRWLDALIPFGSTYRPVWLGLGALAFDALLAVAITSLVRARLGYRIWRAVHWSAYACWGVALAHGIGTGSDTKQTWMLALVGASVLAVLVATGWRIRAGWSGWAPPRLALLAGAVALPPVLVVWMIAGPLHAGWSRVAGTPAQILASSTKRAPAPAAQPAPLTLVLPANATFSGSSQLKGAGTGPVTFKISGTTPGSDPLLLDIRLQGVLQGGGLSVQSGAISVTPPQGAAVYRGAMTGIQSNTLSATLSDGHGDSIGLTVVLSLSGSFSGSGPGSVSGQLGIQRISVGTA